MRGRYGNRWLALAIGVTGIFATMPYIALQLIGMQTVIGALGIPGHIPLIIAFAVLAAFTYTSGLRAPAMISIVKDLLIYLTVIVAIIVIPMELGGFGAMFAKIPPAKLLLATPPAGSGGAYTGYATLALGSAMALFLYPHTTTGILSASGPRVIRRNAALLPAYTIMLGLLALMGFMAIAAGVKSMPQYAAGFAHYGASFAVPALVLNAFPGWFVGRRLRRHRHRRPGAGRDHGHRLGQHLHPRHLHASSSPPPAAARKPSWRSSSRSSWSIGAVVFILIIPSTYAVQMQLLGGMWIIQTFPAIAFSVFTRFFNGWALLIGWAVGIVIATSLVALNHFTGAIWAFHVLGYTLPSYIALATVLVNAVVAFVLSLVFNAVASDRARDETSAADYV